MEHKTSTNFWHNDGARKKNSHFKNQSKKVTFLSFSQLQCIYKEMKKIINLCSIELNYKL